MEQFIDQIPNAAFKSDLEHILHNKKPFQSFKNTIDNSDYRQEWFDFKKLELEKIVEAQLDGGKANTTRI